MNSATRGVGLGEASKLLKMASANPNPLVAEFKSTKILKWKHFEFFSLGELFVPKMLGSGGSSMYHKTFGNMIHPSQDTICD